MTKCTILRSYIVFYLISLVNVLLMIGSTPANHVLLTMLFLAVAVAVPNTLFLMLMYYLNIARELFNVKYLILESFLYVILNDALLYIVNNHASCKHLFHLVIA